jgi:hypothetical protein
MKKNILIIGFLGGLLPLLGYAQIQQTIVYCPQPDQIAFQNGGATSPGGWKNYSNPSAPQKITPPASGETVGFSRTNITEIQTNNAEAPYTYTSLSNGCSYEYFDSSGAEVPNTTFSLISSNLGPYLDSNQTRLVGSGWVLRTKAHDASTYTCGTGATIQHNPGLARTCGMLVTSGTPDKATQK